MLPFPVFIVYFLVSLQLGASIVSKYDSNYMKEENSSDMLIVIYVYGNSESSSLRIKGKEKKPQ